MRLEATTVTAPSLDLVKMEERKRPALGDHDDGAPPLKRQATAVNGTRSHPDADMPWKEEIEVCSLSSASDSRRDKKLSQLT